MNQIYEDILSSIAKGEKLLAVLIDPDKMRPDYVADFIRKVNATVTTHIFVGGSTVESGATHAIVSEIKKYTILPIVIFPGDINQITSEADALLFLSLISGRNPAYLIEKHIEAVTKLRGTSLEVIPTGYVLIENGKETSVERVTETKPLSRDNLQKIIDTCKAGELLGMKLMYLEAGSGATEAIESNIIKCVKNELSIPLIVGGGIRDIETLEHSYISGADLVVIGTAFEENEQFMASFIKERI